MNKPTKLITVLPFLFLLLLIPSSAGAAIPPSDECLAKMDAAIEKFDTISNQTEDKALWQELVDAGCFKKNPYYNEEEDTKKCSAEIAAVNRYLQPINTAMAPVAKRFNRVRDISQDITDKLWNQIKKAEKKGDKKLARQLNNKLNAAWNKYYQTVAKIARQNKRKLYLYDAPVLLAIADLKSQDCNLQFTFYRRNSNALVVWDLRDKL